MRKVREGRPRKLHRRDWPGFLNRVVPASVWQAFGAQVISSKDPRVRWSAKYIVLAWMVMGWSLQGQLTERFREACEFLSQCFARRRRPGESYQGLTKATGRVGPDVFHRFWACLWPTIPQRLGQTWRWFGWVVMGVDGSRIDAPRTRRNEKALHRAGRDKTHPQWWITWITHLPTNLIWDWRQGPGNSAERTHLRKMIPSLPKLNTNNPGVRDYLLYVTRYWLDFGMDGWRLDVPAEIDDDDFWREFRRVVKDANPEAYIVGEIWHPAQRWLKGDMFDAVMNYQITGPIFNFFGSHNLNLSWHHSDVTLKTGTGAEEFRQKIEAMFELYDWEIHYAQMNMLDSHDMPRALWLLNNDKAALRLAVLCQMTMPGAPCVYYGDEIGMSAGGDPHCREAFPWQEPAWWDQDLRRFYQSVIALRKAHAALRTGDFAFLHAEGQVVAYRRRLADEELVVVFNASPSEVKIKLPAAEMAHSSYQVIWPTGKDEQERAWFGRLSLELPAQSALILCAGKEEASWEEPR